MRHYFHHVAHFAHHRVHQMHEHGLVEYWDVVQEHAFFFALIILASHGISKLIQMRRTDLVIRLNLSARSI